MPVVQPPRSHTPLGKRVRGALTDRLPLKAAAIFFAFVLWLIVSVEEPTEELVPVRFQPILDSSLTLESTPPSIRALVIGRGRELLKLYSTPPVVRRVFTADTPDESTIQLRPMDVTLPPGVDAVVGDVQPRRISLRFGAMMRRQVPVRPDLRFTADTGLRIAGPARVVPESVTVVGPRRAVAKIEAVRTVPSDMLVRGDAEFVVALDTAGLGVQVRPAQVRVQVPVERESAPVEPELEETP